MDPKADGGTFDTTQLAFLVDQCANLSAEASATPMFSLIRKHWAPTINMIPSQTKNANAPSSRHRCARSNDHDDNDSGRGVDKNKAKRL